MNYLSQEQFDVLMRVVNNSHNGGVDAMVARAAAHKLLVEPKHIPKTVARYRIEFEIPEGTMPSVYINRKLKELERALHEDMPGIGGCIDAMPPYSNNVTLCGCMIERGRDK